MTCQTCTKFRWRQYAYFSIPSLHASQSLVTQDMGSAIGSRKAHNLNFMNQKTAFKNKRLIKRYRSLRMAKVKFDYICIRRQMIIWRKINFKTLNNIHQDK